MTSQRPRGALGELVQREFFDRMQFPPTERQVAGKLEVSPTTVGNWMEGTSMPKPDNLRALSELTGLSYDRLLEAALADNGYRELPEGIAARRRDQGHKSR